MGNYLSPSVNVIERDLSTSVPALPTSITGMVGEFQWGPCNQIMNITNDKELVDIFGEPNDTNYESFFSIWNFLQYGNNSLVVRVIKESTAKNSGLEIKDATATGTTAIADLILNDDDADSYTPTFGADAKLQIFAKYPGAKGNDFSIALANTADFATANIKTGTTFASEFEYVPESDEFALVIMADDEIKERYIVSLTPGAVDYAGNNNYVEEFINRRSNYILIFNDTGNSTAPDSFEETSLTGGVGETPSTGEIIIAYDLFDNPEDVNVNILIDGGNTNATVQQHIIDNIAEVRKDLVVYLTCLKDDVVNVANISTAISNLITYRKTTLARSTSYTGLYGNWKYQYDQYNDKYRWIPLSGDIAGITAETHYNRDPWFAPAFLNRGIIKNVTKLAINPNRAHRDSLYKNFINPIVRDANVGFVVMGQKTLISTPSSFSRLDVRWLFITVEQAIAAASKYFMGEKNTIFTQRQFKGMVDPYLRDVQGREGIDDFYVQVDDTINTPEVKARNEFHANIFIKPTFTAEFIVLTFTNVKGSISFAEVIKKQQT